MSIVKQVTVTAPVNIAVIKYWGKRDTKLLLPTNSSLSVTLNQQDLKTTTTIACLTSGQDEIYLNGKKEEFNQRLINCITEARKQRSEMESNDEKLEKIASLPIHVGSVNNFPTAAGLASSASGYAALVFALAKLYNLSSSLEELSKIARVGSGSACRSIFGGFVAWEMGQQADGQDSKAIQIAPETHWDDMEALILVVSDAKKGVGSTEGMQTTVQTSDLLQYRISHSVPKRMDGMTDAIKRKDWNQFAEITMMDSNQFHATCLDTFPPIFYLNDVSRSIIQLITRYNALARTNGGDYKVAYTFDAGPNAVVYLPKKNVEEFLGLVSTIYNFPLDKEYMGKAYPLLESIRGNKDTMSKIDALVQQVGMPIQGEGIRRVIYTSVGPGPQLLEGESLLNAQGLPKV